MLYEVITGKAEAALEALKTRDFVYLHVEAPDEASHSGNLMDKIEAIEAFDEKVVGTVVITSYSIHYTKLYDAFRLNLVTLLPYYGKLYMEDFSAGHISTKEARSLIECLQEELGGEKFP